MTNLKTLLLCDRIFYKIILIQKTSDKICLIKKILFIKLAKILKRFLHLNNAKEISLDINYYELISSCINAALLSIKQH